MLLHPQLTPLLLRDEQTEIPVAGTPDRELSWLKITQQEPVRATVLPFLLSPSAALPIAPHCPQPMGRPPLTPSDPGLPTGSHFYLLQQHSNNDCNNHDADEPLPLKTSISSFVKWR